MGIALVKEAMSPTWAGLPAVARLVLVHMATIAYDRSQDNQLGRLYWGGHAPLAMMLMGTDMTDQRARDSATRAVRRAISALVHAGAIERTNTAVNGGRAVYQLTTNRARLPVDNAVVSAVDNWNQ